MILLFIICLLLLICLSSGNRQHIEPQATEPQRAIKKEGYKRFKTINAIKQERKEKTLYQELLKEFYIHNPHGMLLEFKQWEKSNNIQDQAKNPHKYRQIQKAHKPQREIRSSVMSAKGLERLKNKSK